MITTDPDTGPVERSKLVKGYEVSKGEYILLTDEEFYVEQESAKFDIERFVAEIESVRIDFDYPYYIAPDGKLAQEAFGVIRAALERSGQIALGRIVMATRERILALEGRGERAWSPTGRADAVGRQPGEIASPGISTAKPDPAMIAIARKIIEQKEGPFDPSQFVDRYEEALKDRVAAEKNRTQARGRRRTR